MDMKEYKVKGKHKDTGRIRTIDVTALDQQQCKQLASEKELLEPFEIIELSPRNPTVDQLEYAKDLGIDIPEGVTFHEISDLISKKVENDSSDPKQGLIDYANSRNMVFTKYIGKKALYNLVFKNLNGKEKVTFFIFCIYRWLSDDREANLDTHKHKDKIYEIADYILLNEQFLKSMNKYQGSEIMFFGELRTQNEVHYSGGSTNTIAYKTVSEILCKEFNLKNLKIKTLPYNDNSRNKLSTNQLNAPSKKGCLPVIIFFLLNISVVVACIRIN